MRPRTRGALFALIVATLAAVVVASCSKDSPSSVAPLPARSYRMGFSWFPPRPDLGLALQVIDQWAPRADCGLVLVSPPWDSLLAGGDAETLVRGNELGLANHYRSKGLRVVVSIDPTNGLDRSQDAPELVRAGRSLAEPEIQDLFRTYAVAMDTLLRPDWIGLASETNFVRILAPPALYQGVVRAAGAAAADIRAVDPEARLFTTVQVEVAWGRPGGGWVGIAADRADFPFIDALGLSSYPDLGGYAEPEDLPANYYSRLVEGAPLPLFVIEGGWSSETVTAVPSSPDTQRRYIERHARILDEAAAIGWFQITFTDLDLAYYPAGILPFASRGLVTTALDPKPALAAWDAEFARTLRTPPG